MLGDKPFRNLRTQAIKRVNDGVHRKYHYGEDVIQTKGCGADFTEEELKEIHICLECTEPKCDGWCEKMRRDKNGKK